VDFNWSPDEPDERLAMLGVELDAVRTINCGLPI
jgi:hypothetical protein